MNAVRLLWLVSLVINIVMVALAPCLRSDARIGAEQVPYALLSVVAMHAPAILALVGKTEIQATKATARIAIAFTCAYLLLIFLLVFGPTYVDRYNSPPESISWRESFEGQIALAGQVAMLLSPLGLAPLLLAAAERAMVVNFGKIGELFMGNSTKGDGSETRVGDNYKATGSQIAVFGKKGHVDNINDMNFSQGSQPSEAKADLAELAEELTTLAAALKGQAKEPEHFTTIANIMNAEKAAKAGNDTDALSYLKSAGKWAFEVATSIGTKVAAEAMKAVMGI